MELRSGSLPAAPLCAGIEGGGTKFVWGVGTLAADGGEPEIESRGRVDTRDPERTLAEVAEQIQGAAGGRPLAAVGIACFGPLELDPGRARYGHMLPTPKPGWSDAPLAAPLAGRLGAPVALDTDVNGAALGEWLWGAARGCDPAVYLTVGTGIGGGAIVGGRTLTGLLHPEMGHIPIPRLAWPDGTLDTFDGTCPFHGDCFEGLASGPALAARLGTSADLIPDDHPVWDLEAAYLAQALATYTLVLSPQRIILGGGVMQQAHLLPRVRAGLIKTLAGYVTRDQLGPRVDEYVVAPHFGQDAGLYGAFALAQRAADNRED
jgi:fructokinase